MVVIKIKQATAPSPRAVLKIMEMNENPNYKGCDDADTDTEKNARD